MAKPRILVVNNETRYREQLEQMVSDHADGRAEVESVHITQAGEKVSAEDVPYDAIILSGSHKRLYDDKVVQDIIQKVDTYNENNPNSQTAIYGACLGHQALAHYFDGKVEKLDTYQQGSKPITLKATGEEVKTHKSHHWGVTDTGGLEAIAESTVGKKTIAESLKHPKKPIQSDQGHPEVEGHAQTRFYEFLNSLY